MINGMFDFGDDAGWGGFVGGGVGVARVRLLGDSASDVAFQGIAGVRAAVSENIDVGLKYRYFRTGTHDAGIAAWISTATCRPDSTATGTVRIAQPAAEPHL